MSSVGYIYTQEMDEGSSATQGPFYVTNTLRVEHPSIKVNRRGICGEILKWRIFNFNRFYRMSTDRFAPAVSQYTIRIYLKCYF